MPLIKSAIKKMRQDEVRKARNKTIKHRLLSLIANTRKNKTNDDLALVFSALDKAVKSNLIKKGKASRLKSRLSKLELTKPTSKASTKAKKKTKT